MTTVEKSRLALTLESINNGQVNDLPVYIVNSVSEGLGTIANQLIRSNFLNTDH